MVNIMILNPDLIESTTVDDKPTVKRYIHRETGVAYISYYHHSNGIWTTPFIEGSNLDIQSRDICEDDALHCDGAIPNSANGGIVESSEPKIIGESPVGELEPLFPPKEKKEIKPIGRRIRRRASDEKTKDSGDPDINQLHPVDRANYEREQLQALGESLQSGIPPLAAIGQPISCERVTPEYWIIEQDGMRRNVSTLASLNFEKSPYKIIERVPEKREPLNSGHPVSLTGDPVEITSMQSCIAETAPGLRDYSRAYPSDSDSCYSLIDSLRGQVKQLREELGYANDEAKQARASLDTAILLKNQYYDDVKMLEGHAKEGEKIITGLYGENRDLQSSLNKWRNHAEVQHRTMLAAAVLLIFVFVGLCLGW